MTPMDCRTAVDCFSEHHDHRLDLEVRESLSAHLGDCPRCREAWDAYSRVFTLVPLIGETPEVRPFRRPEEPPGGVATIQSTYQRQWRRFAWTAAAVLVLAITHLAIFEFARTGPWGSRELGPIRPARDHLTRVSDARETVRDQVDALDLMVRTIDQMPDDAGTEGVELVSGYLDLVDEVRARLGNSEQALAVFKDRGADVARLSEASDAFAHQVRHGGPASQSTTPVQFLQARVADCGLPEALRPLRSLVIREAPGRAWQQALQQRKARKPDCCPEVQCFLGALEPFLAADYDRSVGLFRAFQDSECESKLVPLAKYVEAEAERRRLNYPRVMELVQQPGVIRRCVTLVPDPMVTMTMTIVSFSGSRGALITHRGSPRVGIFEVALSGVAALRDRMATWKASPGLHAFERRHDVCAAARLLESPPRLRLLLIRDEALVEARGEGLRLYEIAAGLFQHPELSEQELEPRPRGPEWSAAAGTSAKLDVIVGPDLRPRLVERR